MNNRKKRRQGRQQWKKDDSDYDSDDPRSYRNEKAPDPSANEYFHDEVDEFHQEREKILLDVDQTARRDKRSDDEEEVLGWEDDDDSDLEERAKEFQKHHRVDDMASDLEEEADEDDQVTDDRAWGQRKRAFHGTDFVGDNVIDKLQQDEEEEQAAEEEEARLIQRRMAEALDEGDFNVDLIQTAEVDEGGSEVPGETTDTVKQDLSKLSKKEKLQILKKESPELLELVEDCKAKLLEVKECLQPLIERVRSGRLPPNTLGVTYLQTKYHLYLNYCLNINFYMVMKARHISVKNHPVIGRILSYRKLINELKPADDHIREEMEQLLANQETDEETEQSGLVEHKSGKGDVGITRKQKRKKKRDDRKLSSLLDEEGEERKRVKKKKTGGDRLTEDELRALDYYKKMEAEQNEKKALKRDLYPSEEPDEAEMGEGEDMGELEEGEDGDDEEGKRAITYQISKNKGLTARKKKELRNPRVKHRNKFRKAKIRRRGQVVEARTEVNRYGGEMSGIRASVVKSVKLK